ncbi:hypothetical protein [Neptuniibacter sp. QD37_11]|uniref:hypothetical protein n=1 Tax=Neptuniibacter sp. QD37_11 TaxID=3398209 RepID=UPI0039F48D29
MTINEMIGNALLEAQRDDQASKETVAMYLGLLAPKEAEFKREQDALSSAQTNKFLDRRYST